MVKLTEGLPKVALDACDGFTRCVDMLVMDALAKQQGLPVLAEGIKLTAPDASNTVSIRITQDPSLQR